MGAVTKPQKKASKDAANAGSGVVVPDGWDFQFLGRDSLTRWGGNTINEWMSHPTAAASGTNVVWQTTSSNATYCSASAALSKT